jgi:hypothetical protein
MAQYRASQLPLGRCLTAAALGRVDVDFLALFVRGEAPVD